MELNTKHSVSISLLKIYKKRSALIKVAKTLFNSVLILDGTADDPQKMTAGIQELLAETTKMYIEEEAR